MNLIVDAGNTSAKLAVFHGYTCLKIKRVTLSEAEIAIQEFLSEYANISNCIVSSVINLDSGFVSFLNQKFTVLWLNNQSKVPFINAYKTPETLGVDRIALVAAAINQYPKQNCLIIDAGTSVTYDLVTAKAKYLGGAISLGIDMRFKALHQFTAKLPLLEKPEQILEIGNSTLTAIQLGVIGGLVNEIDGFIGMYNQKFSDLTVILTGGDAIFLSKQLKSSIFANSNFLMEGLNSILLYNLNL